ncbi:MAG: hypothetical protein RBR98_03255 [Candidatus Moranbacteria bacterium]|jgi:septal ring factor EnvC (AmiA/AmiB activator)|nr:hypothetical protein [Candidatus Moranbacteria bacterium]NLC31014.1 hypothetical protein [Candidatus Moranbacteria bacterium]
MADNLSQLKSKLNELERRRESTFDKARDLVRELEKMKEEIREIEKIVEDIKD